MGVYSGMTTIKESYGYAAPLNNHVLDLLVENEQNDMNMFNSVIALDFSSAYNEAGYCYVSEAEEKEAKKFSAKAIGDKIAEVFKKLVATVKNFFKTIIAKVQNLLNNDTKLYVKYKDAFNKNYPKYEFKKYRELRKTGDMEAALNIEDYGKMFDQAIAQINSATTRDDVNSAVKHIRKDDKGDNMSAKGTNLINLVDDVFFGKECTGKLPDEQASIVLDVVNKSSSIITSLKKAEAKIQADIKQKNDTLRKAINKDKKNDVEHDELTIAKNNAAFKIASTYSSICSRVTSAYCNGATRYIAAARSMFIKVANYKAANNEEEATTNEAYDYMLGEASDEYVFESLAMC